VAAELERYRGWTAEVGSFAISHGELSISLWSADEWALAYCAAVERIEITPGQWPSALRAEAAEAKVRPGFALVDDSVRLRVVCGMLSVYAPMAAEPAHAPDCGGGE
jgi:hypothetical protein